MGINAIATFAIDKMRQMMIEAIHSQVALDIGDKIIQVDEEIVDLIAWMNSFDGIETIASCQGDENDRRDCYVFFFCEDHESLQSILQVIYQYNWRETININGEEVPVFAMPGAKVEVKYWFDMTPEATVEVTCRPDGSVAFSACFGKTSYEFMNWFKKFQESA